ncbi:MAG: glycosyltransferase [Candidatus Neomarinimicrobiota bacterium]|nr:MAG: glycosyltransferase [Candidatus Neomarinimicrobiota bacterium]
MKIGFLHVGHERHGVRRFGHILSAAVGEKVTVVDWNYEPGLSLETVDPRLETVDLVHIQYNAQFYSSVWGTLFTQVQNLASFLRNCQRPVVVTLHDIYEPGYLKSAYHFSWMDWVKSRVAPYRRSYQVLARYRVWPVVNSGEESRRLRAMVASITPRVIPHYIESMPTRVPPAEAKAKLGLQGKTVYIMLGFLHPRKRQDLAIACLPHLPRDWQLILVGGAVPAFAYYQNDLLEQAKGLGVEKQVTITGYIPDDRLPLYLSAADAAICPFANVSASGSLSTLMAGGVPIVASALPLFEEYNEMTPNAILIVPDENPVSYSRALQTVVSERNERRKGLQNLARQLSPQKIADRYLELYREILL